MNMGLLYESDEMEKEIKKKETKKTYVKPVLKKKEQLPKITGFFVSPGV